MRPEILLNTSAHHGPIRWRKNRQGWDWQCSKEVTERLSPAKPAWWLSCSEGEAFQINSASLRGRRYTRPFLYWLRGRIPSIVFSRNEL